MKLVNFLRSWRGTAVLPILTLLLLALSGCASVSGESASSAEARPFENSPNVNVQITFTADPPNLQPGECATLQWNVQDGEVAYLDGQPVVLTGQQKVCPQETTSYSLAVYVGVGPPNPPQAERKVVITVEGTDQPPTVPTATTPTAPSLPPAAAQVSVLRDLEYVRSQVNGAEQSLRLDLYLPEQNDPQPSPLLIYIHGGGWFEGGKEGCPATAFAQNGYAVACVDYRLADLAGGCSPDRTFPAQIYDVKTAVRWLRSHAAEYGLDPERFGAMGESSGGHLAALLGASHNVAALEGAANPGVSDAVQAVSDWYGPVYITQGPVVFTDDPCTTSLDTLNAAYGGEETPYFYWTLAWGVFLGGSLTDATVLSRAAQATPLTFVDATDPPFLIIHGENDGMVPIAQSELLAAALQEAGVDVTFVRLPGFGHGYAGPPGSGQEVAPAFLEPTLAFFDRILLGIPEE